MRSKPSTDSLMHACALVGDCAQACPQTLELPQPRHRIRDRHLCIALGLQTHSGNNFIPRAPHKPQQHQKRCARTMKIHNRDTLNRLPQSTVNQVNFRLPSSLRAIAGQAHSQQPSTDSLPFAKSAFSPSMRPSGLPAQALSISTICST